MPGVVPHCRGRTLGWFPEPKPIPANLTRPMEASSAAPTTPTASGPTTVIEPPTGWGFPNLREIWEHRDLIYFLARRDIVTRYRQAVVGSFWVILQPILLAIVFSIFLGFLTKVDAPEAIPYPVFAVTGMVLWLAFVDAVSAGSDSAIGGEALISKIYLPRATLPIAAVIPATIDFALGMIVALAVMFAYGVFPNAMIIFIPVVWLLALATAFGIVLWFSALHVRYRDIGQVVAFLTLAGLFVTPIIYPIETVTANFSTPVQVLYALNPMVGVLELFRWSLLHQAWPGLLLIPTIVFSTLLLITGAIYFERTQRSFADYI